LPLRVDKIVRILKVKFHSTAFPIYGRGAANAQSIGRNSKRLRISMC
jgi:hypothetical protein